MVPALDRILDKFEQGGLTAAFDQPTEDVDGRTRDCDWSGRAPGQRQQLAVDARKPLTRRGGAKARRASEVLAVAVPLVTLAVGVWCGIRFERHRRDRELDDLSDEEALAAEGRPARRSRTARC